MFILERVVSLLAPYGCIVCGHEGPIVCGYCEPDLCVQLPSHCYRCNAMTVSNAVCATCRRLSPLRHVWIASDYGGNATKLVHGLKFEGIQTAAAVMARAMHDTLPYLENTTLVPVPTATSRVRQRGYDHAGLLASNLARLTNLPSKALLGRLGQTRQVGTKRFERQAQLRGAFWPLYPKEIQDANILLIDDVTTTGATLEQAAKVLRQAGAKTVNAIVFAQKQ